MADDAGWRPLRPPATHEITLSATPFARLAVPHALSAAGDALVTIALAGSLFFDISPSAARGRVALSLVLTIAPFAVVAPLLGPAVDRLQGGRRLMVFAAAAARVVVCLAMVAVIDDLLLFPMAFLSLVLSKAHGVSKSALVPSAVPSDDQLVEANAKLALLAVVAGFVAAVPGVIVLQLGGGTWVLGVGAVAFASAAVTALRIMPARPAQPDAEPSDVELNSPHVLAAATAMAVLRGVTGFLAFSIAFAFRRSGAASWWFGLALGASMIGSLAASVVAPPLRARLREERIIAGSLVLVAIVGLVAARGAGRPAAVALAATVGFAAGTAKLCFDAIVQRDGVARARGKAFARFEAAFQLVWVAGALLPVLVVIPERVAFFVVALASALAALAFLLGRGPTPDRESRQDGVHG